MKSTASEQVKYQTSVRAVAITVATINGLPVDRKGFHEALAVFDIGDLSATGPVDVTVQETVDDPASPGNPLASGWAAVTGAVFPQFVNTTNESKHVVGRLDLQKRKRHLRLVAIGSGSAPTGSMQGGFVLLAATSRPVTQTAAVAFNV